MERVFEGETRGKGPIHIYHIAIFGVDHGRHAEFSRLHHDLKHMTVAEFHGMRCLRP